MSLPSPVVASSSTLWATASKEWVIPAKPKPGRKPKKEALPPQNEDPEQFDHKGRRVQNRAAQRAFRERKQSQLAELQARVQQYEQGEIERNVALQNIAKRLKEENDKLRQENQMLKDKVARLEKESADPDKKRGRDDSPGGQPSKKTRLSSDSSGVPSLSTSYLPSPSSPLSSSDSNDGMDALSSFPPSSRDASVFPPRLPAIDNIFDLPSSNSRLPGIFDNNSSLAFEGSCGFCDQDNPCVCREVALQEMTDKIAASTAQPQPKVEQIDTIAPSPIQSNEKQYSILDNLPAYQPPVPLRRKGNGNTSTNSVFPVTVAEPQRPITPSCSGDPSNCLACADDTFGKAFCSAIGRSVASVPCGTCPTEAVLNPSAPNPGCCGDPNRCARNDPMSPVPTCAALDFSAEVIPTDDAWRRLKTHPNVAFADLSLLADVVARRSRCSGPQVVISPAPGSITPEREMGPPTGTHVDSSSSTSRMEQDNQSVLLTDPHAHYRERQMERGRSSPPRLVPQEVLIRCGRGRVREVYADGVREALRLLDAKFAH